MSKQLQRVTRIGFVTLAALALGGCAVGIVAPDAKWEEVSRAGMAFGEGVVAAKDGRIYASDITPTFAIKQNNPGGIIWRYDPASGRSERYLQPSGQSNGLHVGKDGQMLIAQMADGGGRALIRRNLATGVTSMVTGAFQGKQYNSLNDVTSDAQGRIYFTDPRFFGNEPMELPNAVYRVDPNGVVTALPAGLERPNGIEVSPDGRTLYVSTSNLPRYAKNPHGPAKDAFGIEGGGVVAYDLDEKGNISKGRVIFRSGTEVVTDGMALDTDGNVYIAMHNGNPKAPKSDIAVITPSGEVLARIPLPNNALSTNLGFGRGADANSLYANSALPWRLWRIKTVRRGFYFE
jgi:gluconolactonase